METLLEQQERIIYLMEMINEQRFNSKTFKNRNEGDGFRLWFNKNLPKEAKKIQLDTQGPFNNSYIIKALNTPYKGSTAGKIYLKSRQKPNWTKKHDFIPYKKRKKLFDRSTFKNRNEGNNFRAWFNKYLPKEAKRIQLDPQGHFNNSYIIKALNTPYKGSTAGRFYFRNNFNKVKFVKKSNKTKPVKNFNWTNKTTKQVREQVNYLKSIKFNKPFTILDDSSSKVYAVNKDYSLYKEFNVVTGRHRGDEKKIITITNWYINGLIKHIKKTYNDYKQTRSLNKTITRIKNDYLNSPLFSIKNTPSGIYTRDNDLWGFLGKIRNLILTSKFFESIYGTKYISWETLDGKLIPIGFHGTQSKVRLNSINKIKPPSKRKISYGCINFNDNDILIINKFIKIGQHSFWLPDKTNEIVKF